MLVCFKLWEVARGLGTRDGELDGGMVGVSVARW